MASPPDKMTLTTRVSPEVHSQIRDAIERLNERVPGYKTDFNKLSILWIERFLAGDPAFQPMQEAGHE